MPVKKFYVVWTGLQTGVFETWDECKKATAGYIGAQFKSFPDKDQAVKALNDNPYKHIGNKKTTQKKAPSDWVADPIKKSIAVDAACNMVTGEMEYRGVFAATGEVIFKMGPFHGASNNIGEFLALVHALAWCKAKNMELPIYSDSKTAIAWVRNKKAKTTVQPNGQNDRIFELISRAEAWISANIWPNKILKWDTENWGEIPADYGRK